MCRFFRGFQISLVFLTLRNPQQGRRNLRHGCGRRFRDHGLQRGHLQGIAVDLIKTREFGNGAETGVDIARFRRQGFGRVEQHVAVGGIRRVGRVLEQPRRQGAFLVGGVCLFRVGSKNLAHLCGVGGWRRKTALRGCSCGGAGFWSGLIGLLEQRVEPIGGECARLQTRREQDAGRERPKGSWDDVQKPHDYSAPETGMRGAIRPGTP